MTDMRLLSARSQMLARLLILPAGLLNSSKLLGQTASGRGTSESSAPIRKSNPENGRRLEALIRSAKAEKNPAKALVRVADVAEALLYSGRPREALGWLRPALATFEKCCETIQDTSADPDATSAYFVLGLALERTGAFEEMAVVMHNARSVYPNSPGLGFFEGEAHCILGRYDQGQALLQREADRWPDFRPHMEWLRSRCSAEGIARNGAALFCLAVQLGQRHACIGSAPPPPAPRQVAIYSEHIPAGFVEQLRGWMTQGEELKAVTLAKDGAFAVLFGKNGFRTNGVPQAMLDRMWAVHNAGGTLESTALNAEGLWAVLSDHDFQSAAYNTFNDSLQSFIGKEDLIGIALGDAGRWLIARSAANYSAISAGPLKDSMRANLDRSHLPITHVSLFGSDGYVVILGANAWMSHRAPAGLTTALSRVKALGWVIRGMSVLADGSWIMAASSN